MDQADLAEVGTDLSNRIAEFERRIAALKKKCAHRVDNEGTDEGLRWGLGLRRERGQWRLFYCRFGTKHVLPDDLNPHEIAGPLSHHLQEVWVDEWTPLSDVSLERKARAASFFPEFLSGMRAEYERRASLVREAHKKLDDFEAHLLAAETEDE